MYLHLRDVSAWAPPENPEKLQLLGLIVAYILQIKLL